MTAGAKFELEVNIYYSFKTTFQFMMNFCSLRGEYEEKSNKNNFDNQILVP